MFNISLGTKVIFTLVLTATPTLFLSVTCSYIGKTDQNPPLVVSQSCQRPQGVPQQGKKTPDF